MARRERAPVMNPLTPAGGKTARVAPDYCHGSYEAGTSCCDDTRPSSRDLRLVDGVRKHADAVRPGPGRRRHYKTLTPGWSLPDGSSGPETLRRRGRPE